MRWGRKGEWCDFSSDSVDLSSCALMHMAQTHIEYRREKSKNTGESTLEDPVGLGFKSLNLWYFVVKGGHLS